jgi:cytochrome c556
MDPADWKRWSQDMYSSSQELIKALQAKDAMKVKAAAMNLNKSCTECHAVFR